jgi:hypothetical protein
MRAADQILLDSSKFKPGSSDGLILLSYAAFAIVFLVLIYVASMSAGTAAADFASMSAFP